MGNPDNLLLNKDDPTLPPDPCPQTIDDIDTGSLYRDGWDLYCKIPGQDVLCGLIFFIDKPTQMHMAGCAWSLLHTHLASSIDNYAISHLHGDILGILLIKTTTNMEGKVQA